MVSFLRLVLCISLLGFSISAVASEDLLPKTLETKFTSADPRLAEFYKKLSKEERHQLQDLIYEMGEVIEPAFTALQQKAVDYPVLTRFKDFIEKIRPQGKITFSTELFFLDEEEREQALLNYFNTIVELFKMQEFLNQISQEESEQFELFVNDFIEIASESWQQLGQKINDFSELTHIIKTFLQESPVEITFDCCWRN
jgi:hypothetical protein